MHKNPLRLVCFALLAASLLSAQQTGPVLLDSFVSPPSPRLSTDGSTYIWQLITSEESGQTIVYPYNNDWLRVTGSPDNSCTSAIGCGLYYTLIPSGTTGYWNQFIENYTLRGTADYTKVDRLRFKFKCNADVAQSWNGWGNLQIGTYIKSHNYPDVQQQGQHYYHYLDPHVYPNQWIMVELNWKPTWEVGGTPPLNLPVDPEWTNPDSYGPVHYFDGLTRMYFDTQNVNGINGWHGVTCDADDWYFDSVTGEPDYDIYGITGTYNGSAYEVVWNTPAVVVGGEKYNVYYSTTGSMKNCTLGQAGCGTSGGVVTGFDDSAYTIGARWTSPAMSQANMLWVAILPQNPQGSQAGQFTEFRIPRMDESHVGIAVTSLSNGAVGTAYSQTVWGYAGISPFTWSIAAGNLPNGLSLNPNSGVISGTPTANGTSNFTVQIADSTPGSPLTASQNLSITIGQGSSNPCDLNGDGVVNQADYNIAINLALQQPPTGTDDLDGDGIFDIVDVQRIANAANGQPCKVGP
jgi:hypothetical protein